MRTERTWLQILAARSASPAVQWALLGAAAAMFAAVLWFGFAPRQPSGQTSVAGVPTSTAPGIAPDADVIAVATGPQQLAPLTPQQAFARNAAVPIAPGSVPIARPYAMIGVPEESFARAADCLAAAIYYEANGESETGRLAVAQVVLNRLRHPAFPKTVCAVVFQGSERATGCQFTFTCDGALTRPPSPEGWRRARALAEAALSGRIVPQVGWATHYHTQWVLPLWAPSLVKTAVIGAHIFYRLPDRLGAPGAFGRRPLQTEPQIAAMAAFAVPAAVPETQITESMLEAGLAPRASAGVEAVAVDGIPTVAVQPSATAAQLSPAIAPASSGATEAMLAPPELPTRERRRRGRLPM